MVKTFCLAVSLALSAVPQQKSAADGSVWDKVKGSLLVVEHLGQPTGVAALIDPAGLLLVHKSALRGGVINLRGQDGSVYIAVIVSEDDVTQTALLQAPPPLAPRALSVASEARAGQRIVAATAAGPAFGQIVATDRVGQMRPSLRYLPLSEVWMESGSSTQGPAVLVNEQGEIVGLLGASLAENSAPGAAKASASGGGAEAEFPADYGPRSLQVSYAIGPRVMRRVVEGFRSPARSVHHPTIGVLFRMSSGAGGVILDTVLAGSTAEAAGLRAGDRVLRVEGKSVKDSVQLAIALFEAAPGSTITIEFERDGQTKVARVAVAGQETTLTSRTIHL